jgi:hypothetical protein
MTAGAEEMSRACHGRSGVSRFGEYGRFAGIKVARDISA